MFVIVIKHYGATQTRSQLGSKSSLTKRQVFRHLRNWKEGRVRRPTLRAVVIFIALTRDVGLLNPKWRRYCRHVVYQMIKRKSWSMDLVEIYWNQMCSGSASVTECYSQQLQRAVILCPVNQNDLISIALACVSVIKLMERVKSIRLTIRVIYDFI